MPSAASNPRPPVQEDEEIDDSSSADDGYDADADLPDELTDELCEETGIDLSDASELDADNVPADEEHDRVRQAPD